MRIPCSLLTDAYKQSHFKLYPPDTVSMTAYAEFRCSFEGDEEDQRIVYYGIRHIVEEYIAKPWTNKDIDDAKVFFSTFGAGKTTFPFPEYLFRKFIQENDGYFPVRIESLPEGSVVYPHVPVMCVTASEDYAVLVTWLETILTMVWYPSTVATLSRRTRTVLEDFLKRTCDNLHVLPSRLHDFGFRACTSIEQSVLGGAAHLLNFDGTDTLSAAFHVQFNLNNGRPVASSIPASEHSIMTSWRHESDALESVLGKYYTSNCIVACVMDSYDYKAALDALLPNAIRIVGKQNAYLVLRPDSGDPVATVLMALEAGEKVFGFTLNSKGYKVVNGCGVIQGDGINYDCIKQILEAVVCAKYSTENVAFGMGGGLLQKLNRDTMSFATKLCYVKFANGEERNVLKMPKEDSKKCSLPGLLDVRRINGLIYVFPKESGTLMNVVYDGFDKRNYEWNTFDEVRNRLNIEWEKSPKLHDPISSELAFKIKECSALIRNHLSL